MTTPIKPSSPLHQYVEAMTEKQRAENLCSTTNGHLKLSPCPSGLKLEDDQSDDTILLSPERAKWLHQALGRILDL